jgi:Ca-activated chloride channel family protein
MDRIARSLRIASFLVAAWPAAPLACDVALALTVDVSGSISPTEYELQMNGVADAMEDPQIAESLIAGNIAITVVQWSGSGKQTVSIPWVVVDSAEELTALTTSIRSTERAWRHFSTAIGEALDFTGALFAEAPACGRNVIDVSGDGFSNEGGDVTESRSRLVAQGVVINGLAIENAVEGLTVYYGKEVIGGEGSFVLTATSYRDYPRAIRRKLINEVVKPAS